MKYEVVKDFERTGKLFDSETEAWAYVDVMMVIERSCGADGAMYEVWEAEEDDVR